ncbi:MAG: hypothetical protein HKN48_06060 [Flavobacteriaceae bacterium]|nr:hypothetical protein [Flavobacteriaceae bacterium]
MREKLKIYLIVNTIVLALSLFPALVMILFSAMMFDSPGSEDNLITVSIVICMIAYPIMVLLGITLSWILFAKKKGKISILTSLIPYLNLLIIIALFVALEVLCNGNFAC